jgi:tetratricopeptide (TPR) repeat protein
MQKTHLVLAVLLAAGGCAPAATGVRSSSGPAASADMDYFTALKLARNWGPVTYAGGGRFQKKLSLTSDESGVTATLEGGTYRCLYKNNTDLRVESRFLASPPTSVRLQCQQGGLNVWDSASESAKLVASWKFLAAGPPTESPEKAAAFQEIAAKYAADPGSFAMPEEARAFKVQAETAVKEKRFGDAADRFSKALAISPWWATGHFNLALVYSELELPGMAIAEMEKYLKLAPQAENARAAQDKIYVWKDKVQH